MYKFIEVLSNLEILSSKSLPFCHSFLLLHSYIDFLLYILNFCKGFFLYFSNLKSFIADVAKIYKVYKPSSLSVLFNARYSLTKGLISWEFILE